MAKPKKKEGFLETIKTIIFALILAGIFRTLFFQPFWIPSGSMKDTLLIGDFLFVNKMSYGYSYASCPTVRIAAIGLNIEAEDICGFLRGGNKRILGAEPKRGDVVVFRHPSNGQDYIKRLIALPGEKVQIKNGLVFINGTPVEVIPDGTFDEVRRHKDHLEICLAVQMRSLSKMAFVRRKNLWKLYRMEFRTLF